MSSPDRPICTIHVGAAASEEQARETASLFKNCPYAVMYVSHGQNVVGVFVLPARKRWWADVEDRPELFALHSLQVFFSDRVDVHSAWSKGQVKPDLESPPCGSDCTQCPQRLDKCEGCPAWRGSRQS